MVDLGLCSLTARPFHSSVHGAHGCRFSSSNRGTPSMNRETSGEATVPKEENTSLWLVFYKEKNQDGKDRWRLKTQTCPNSMKTSFCLVGLLVFMVPVFWILFLSSSLWIPWHQPLEDLFSNLDVMKTKWMEKINMKINMKINLRNPSVFDWFLKEDEDPDLSTYQHFVGLASSSSAAQRLATINSLSFRSFFPSSFSSL